MPEAPEVQNVLNYLQEQLQNHKITSVEISHPKLSGNMDYHEMEKKLTNQTFHKFFRHGKYLVFELDDLDWISHLRMEGKFLIEDKIPEDPKINKHIHAKFHLDNGKWLLYMDTRKFGRMQVYPRTEDYYSLPAFDKVGPDVLSDQFSAKYLHNKLKNRKCAIKTSLLNQSIVAGIGNIYADEILFDAGLDPRSITSHLDLEDCKKIVDAAKQILSESVKSGGTTIRSFEYGNHLSGTYQDSLKVHQKSEEICSRCHGTIEKVIVNQRSTYVCPACQIRK